MALLGHLQVVAGEGGPAKTLAVKCCSTGLSAGDCKDVKVSCPHNNMPTCQDTPTGKVPLCSGVDKPKIASGVCPPNGVFKCSL